MTVPIPWPILAQVGLWTQQALNAAKDRRQQRFAHVVADAGIIVAGLRRAERELRLSLNPLLTYQSEFWDLARRNAFAEDLTAFVSESLILPRMRAALTALRALESQQSDFILRMRIKLVISLADRTCEQLLDPIGMSEDARLDPTWGAAPPERAAKALVPLLVTQLLATQPDADLLRARVSKFLAEDLVELAGVVTQLETMFGELLAMQQQEFPGLPVPDWVWA